MLVASQLHQLEELLGARALATWLGLLQVSAEMHLCLRSGTLFTLLEGLFKHEIIRSRQIAL